MRVDSLRSLLKIRKTSTEAAKIALSEAISAETKAGAKAAEADRRILDEAEAALSLCADDGAVEVYARWLPRGRREASQARVALGLATQEVTLARTALSMARAAEHAIAVELEKAESDIALMRARKAQAELDEIGARQAISRSASGKF